MVCECWIKILCRDYAMKKVILYIHGKDGSHLEAKQYKKNCLGFDLVGVEYDDYLPWVAQKKFKSVYETVFERYDCVYLIANSIGAYLAMHALQDFDIAKALFISPVLDMERLILDMMSWANISEEDLREKGEISTEFGETLSWKYLCFVRENHVIWNVYTEILCAENDNLVSRQTINQFIGAHNANLTVMENGEHWFHTDEQLAFLDSWMEKAIR